MLEATCISLPCSSINNIFNPFLEVTPNIATYNWPWENTDYGRYTPTWLRDYPWLLLMVMANKTNNKNCRRWKLKRMLLSDGINDNHGMKTLWPICLPDITCASGTYAPIFVMTSRVPLHSPNVWSIFLKSITETPTFNFSLWFRSLEAKMVFRNSDVCTSVCTSAGPLIVVLVLYAESQLK